jgi:hypothetical protein
MSTWIMGYLTHTEPHLPHDQGFREALPIAAVRNAQNPLQTGSMVDLLPRLQADIKLLFSGEDSIIRA